MEEIKETLGKKYNDWKNISFSDVNKTGEEPLSFETWMEMDESECHKVPVVVLFDKGWQRRGHCSISGHAFMIGVQTKKILAHIICAKECDKCKRLHENGKITEPHPCPKNDEGSSKVMKADAALELTKRMFANHPIYIEKLVANDDSGMKALVRHSYKEKEKEKHLFPL
eukprot:12970681-Ditylum_brightwellii.AAC.1